MTHERRITEAEHEWRSHTRKIAYPDMAGAQAAVDEIYRSSGDVLERYPCEFCPGYHIGHPMTNLTTRRAAKRLEKARRKTLWKEAS